MLMTNALEIYGLRAVASTCPQVARLYRGIVGQYGLAAPLKGFGRDTAAPCSSRNRVGPQYEGT